MKCPKCGGSISALLYCKDLDCGFSISKEKFDVIVEDLYKPKFRRQIATDENLSDLNNFGLDEVAEDFSDSPHLDI